MIKLKKILLETKSQAATDALLLGLYHLGYGRYAVCKDFQCHVVAFSKKGELKFVRKNRSEWEEKLKRAKEKK